MQRKVDQALLTGRATWTDDIAPPGTLHMVVVRSPLPHARIVAIDTNAAAAVPGVRAVLTAADVDDEFLAGIPCGWPVTEDIRVPDHRPLARDEVNHVGDGVAVVLATSAAAARDGADLVDVEYAELPAVVDMADALADGAPVVHEEMGTNHCYTWPLATGDVDAAFADAEVVVSGRYLQQRVIPSPMEPRAVVCVPDQVGAGFTVYTATQVPHFVRDILAAVTGIPDTRIRVVAPDVGGGFGAKLNVYAEEFLALVLARRLRAPVKWTETRSEHHLATTHGRGQIQDVSVAATRRRSGGRRSQRRRPGRRRFLRRLPGRGHGRPGHRRRGRSTAPAAPADRRDPARRRPGARPRAVAARRLSPTAPCRWRKDHPTGTPRARDAPVRCMAVPPSAGHHHPMRTASGSTP